MKRLADDLIQAIPQQSLQHRIKVLNLTFCIDQREANLSIINHAFNARFLLFSNSAFTLSIALTLNANAASLKGHKTGQNDQHTQYRGNQLHHQYAIFNRLQIGEMANGQTSVRDLVRQQQILSCVELGRCCRVVTLIVQHSNDLKLLILHTAFSNIQRIKRLITVSKTFGYPLHLLI